MAEKIQGRPWQPHEDALLLDAIHSTQGDIDWKVIAKSVPDRTNKACRKVCGFVSSDPTAPY